MFHLSISGMFKKYSFVRTEGYDHYIHFLINESKMSGFTYNSVRLFALEIGESGHALLM